jgi:hypothetical protein
MINFASSCLGRGKLGFILAMGLFVCVACGGQPAASTDTALPANDAVVESPATSTPASAGQPSEEQPTEVAPASVDADEVEDGADLSQSLAEEDWAFVATVEGDYFVRGNPAAPVRLIDYSDFL